MQFAFRSEFRPLGILQNLFSPVSPPYRGNTTFFDGFLALVPFWVLGCRLGLPFGVSVAVLFVSFSHHYVVFPILLR